MFSKYYGIEDSELQGCCRCSKKTFYKAWSRSSLPVSDGEGQYLSGVSFFTEEHFGWIAAYVWERGESGRDIVDFPGNHCATVETVPLRQSTDFV